MTPSPVEIDLPFCYAAPRARPVDEAAVKALAASIAESGLLNPITVRRMQKSRAGKMCDAYEIVAGLHRVKAFRRLGRETIPAFIVEPDDLHAELLLIDENLCRNDLTPAERFAALARRKAIHAWLHGSPKAKGAHAANAAMGNEHDANAKLADAFTTETAALTGRSERSVQRDLRRGEALGEEILRVVRTSLDKGDELDALAKLAPEARAALIDRAAAGEKVSAKVEAKKQARAEREAELGARQCALPARKFGVVYADPEWRWEPWSAETGMDRAAANHYPTSPTEAIAARMKTQLATIAADDCVLLLWATNPMLPDALRVMAACGFAYKTNFAWGKDRIATGYWNRERHELLLVGTRGAIPAPAMGTQWDSLQLAPRGEHSAKPDLFCEMIERYFPNLPKIELNRRGPARPGWAAWGNEAELRENGRTEAKAAGDDEAAADEESLDRAGDTFWSELSRDVRAVADAPTPCLPSPPPAAAGAGPDILEIFCAKGGVRRCDPPRESSL